MRVGGPTDDLKDMEKLTFDIRNFTNAPKMAACPLHAPPLLCVHHSSYSLPASTDNSHHPRMQRSLLQPQTT